MAPNLDRLRPHRLVGVAFAFALIGASAPIAIAAPPPKPPPPPAVLWSPSSLSLTVTRGTSTTASAAFTAAKKLATVTASDTGGTASFVTESPTSLKSVPAGTPVTVTLTVAVPVGAALGDYTGSVVVSSSRKAVANALPITVHVVAPTGHIYWTNASVGIGRADLDGSNADEAFIPAIDAGQPVGVAVDSQYVYWTDANNHSIGRANLDGTNPDPNFLPLTYLDPGDRVTQPLGIAVDGQHIYWADADYPSVGRANLDGSNVLPGFIDLTDVTCGPGNPSSCALPTGVAVNAQHVYWTDEVWQGGSIGIADLNGTNANKSFLVIGGGSEWGITTDAQHLYWAWSIYPADGYVGRANLDGSAANSAFISTSSYQTVGLGVDSADIYWSDNFGVNGRIGRSALDGSNQEPSFIPLSGAPPFLAVGN